jgi:hypothetical protein
MSTASTMFVGSAPIVFPPRRSCGFSSIRNLTALAPPPIGLLAWHQRTIQQARCPRDRSIQGYFVLAVS